VHKAPVGCRARVASTPSEPKDWDPGPEPDAVSGTASEVRLSRQNKFQRGQLAQVLRRSRHWRLPSPKGVCGRLPESGYSDLEPRFVAIEIGENVGVGFSGPLELNP
jgi:hypothetical protein